MIPVSDACLNTRVCVHTQKHTCHSLLSIVSFPFCIDYVWIANYKCCIYILADVA